MYTSIEKKFYIFIFKPIGDPFLKICNIYALV